MSLAELFKQAKDKGYNLTIQNDSNLDVVFVRMSQGIRRYNFAMSIDELLIAGDNEKLETIITICEKNIGV